MDEFQPIIISELEGSDDLFQYLCRMFSINTEINHNTIEKEKASNQLRGYFKKHPAINKNEVKRFLVYNRYNTGLDKSLSLGYPSFEYTSELSLLIASVCLAGASRIFIKIIEEWVKGKNKRKITIKHGEKSFIIEGNVKEKKIEKIIDIFEKRFGTSEIIKP